MNYTCRISWLLFAVSFFAAGWPVSLQASEEAQQRTITFSTDIQPILSNKCFTCHGPDEATREADLRLDRAEDAQHAIVPGDPEASELVARITSADSSMRMPPADSGLELTLQEIDLLVEWVAQGARYDRHWSFEPIERPELPGVSSDWVRNPIDRFVLRRLRKVGLSPSPEADRETLIRRVHLDLLGLPPTPEQLDAFLQDRSAGAYQRMVERALANPHYGERWGRYWLDQARYADSHGYTIDSKRSMWPYRDWVIEAINDDLPFDQFTLEQLAGDLLPEPTRDQLVATGFHRNTLINQEGGTDDEQFRNEAVVDRVDTTGAVWLGLTVGCAQCHSHKFDPLTQREYYQLFAFFNSTQDVNSVSPTFTVADAAQQEKLDEFDREIAAAKTALEQYDEQQNEQRPEAERDDGEPLEWTVVESAAAEASEGATFEPLGDGSLLAGGPNGDSETYRVTFRSPLSRITALRLETLTHPSLPKGGPGRADNGNFVLNELTMHVGDGEAEWLHATADHSQKNYDVAGAIDGDPESGWAINVEKGRANVNRTAQFVSEALPAEDQAEITVTLTFGAKPPKYNIGRFRLAVTDAPHAKLDLPDPHREKLTAELSRLQKAKRKYASKIPKTMVMRELDEPRETHVLIRGDFLREGEAVQPGTPAVLPELPEASSRPTRLDLAKWLVDRDNPLTARVTVNRMWDRLFGRGLVETENDFGIQGTPPSHPELLDWLAAEFMGRGWSRKQLHRLILTSATYRQSSDMREELTAADPLNKLLGRQSRLRVQAEIIRDLGLAVSGLLHRRIGGPSVYPPQPDGVYAFTQRKASWPTSTGGDRYRRGIYTFFMRSAPYPMLTTFDTPRFNKTCTRRVRSNTPLQSLTLANDVTVLENARALAQRLQQSGEDDQERIEHAYRLCFARAPEPYELKRLVDFVQQQRLDLTEAPEDAKAITGSDKADVDLATWTLVARLFMNLDEFITRE